MSICEPIFHYLCHQDAARSFVISGHTLPFCHRCTGLYIGLALAAITILATQTHRKGWPPITIVYTSILSLALMPIFGYHLLDPGSAVRLFSGLIYGMAIANLLVPATAVICIPSATRVPHTTYSRLAFCILLLLITTTALWFPIQSIYCYHAALALALIGLLTVVLCIASLIFCAAAKMLLSLLSKGLEHG
jgi:uncharacterized membrane protein